MRSRPCLRRPLTALLALAAIVVAPAVRAQTGLREVVGRDPVDAILNALQTHKVVGFGETHNNLLEHQVLQRVLRDPRFPTLNADVVVELGNGRYQRLVDRYVAGDRVPADSLQVVWRDGLFPLLGDWAEYHRIVHTVREINLSLPTARRIRVVLAQPPFDWASVSSEAVWDRLNYLRDLGYIDRIDREVLRRGHRALAVFGAMHFLRRPFWTPGSGTGDAAATRLNRHRAPVLGELLEQRHPGGLHFVWARCQLESDQDSMEKRLASLSFPSLVRLQDTWLGQLDFRLYLREAIPDPDSSAWRTQRFEDVADACLYLGPLRSHVAPQPDPAFYSGTEWIRTLLSRVDRLGERGRRYRRQIEANVASLNPRPPPHP